LSAEDEARYQALVKEITDYAEARLVAPGEPINDVALVQLAADAPEPFTPAVLPSDGASVAVGERKTVVGYGLASATDPGSNGVLRQGIVQVSQVNTAAHELVVVAVAGQMHCHGDSGGPLYGGGGVLIGIVDRGQSANCISPPIGVATDVSAYLPWIRCAEAQAADPVAFAHNGCAANDFQRLDVGPAAPIGEPFHATGISVPPTSVGGPNPNTPPDSPTTPTGPNGVPPSNIPPSADGLE
jgi:hypothetical protein